MVGILRFTSFRTLADVLCTHQASNHIRKITRKQLNDLEIKTLAETAAMNHRIKQVTRENRDWRFRVETVNASFRHTQEERLRSCLQNVQNLADGHNRLREHVLRERREVDSGIQIIETRVELANEEIDEMREENEALGAKSREMEARVVDLERLVNYKL